MTTTEEDRPYTSLADAAQAIDKVGADFAQALAERDAARDSVDRAREAVIAAIAESGCVTADGWNRDDCTTWCVDTQHACDPACWGSQSADEHDVVLSLEDGFPREAVQPYDRLWLRQYQEDPPRVSVYAYRGRPGYREVVYLHLYRPHDSEHLDYDASVHMTAQEAVQLAHYLMRVAATVDPNVEGNQTSD